VNLAFKPFDYSEYRTIFSIDNSKNAKENNFNIVSLARRKSVLFLNQSDNDHSMDALVNLFYTQTLQTLISEADAKEDGRLEVPVRLIIDDFASGAKLEDFDRIISVVRSRDIWLTMCMQSFTQLQTLYTSAQALTVINNCNHIIYLGSNDLGSAEFIGTRAKKNLKRFSASTGIKSLSLKAENRPRW
jgi:type IV secretion system protein VirD4